jgi:cell division protein FtsB
MGDIMATTSKQPRPTGTMQSVRQIEQRLAALEKAMEGLLKTVGDLKYELEQMREE